MNEKYAIVTGSEQGIGKALITDLARQGYNVLINYFLSKDNAAAVAKTCEGFGVKAFIFEADVREYEQVKAMKEFAVANLGTNLQVFVNNSGIGLMGNLTEQPVEDYVNIIRTDLIGAMHCAHEFAPLMAANKYGRYILIGSTSGLMPSPGFCAYETAKAGIIGLTRGLALEMGKYSVTVNNIAPGFINTEASMNWGDEFMEGIKKTTALYMVGTPDDVVGVMNFIINSPYLTGQTIPINGGSYMI